ncbi:MAG: trypsin-like peptidase domain-containing protein, partial [Planctomycetes bacterium]|nr:trypsin-like peptidase domain-containing protein [Planctomycetota bacterium]
MTTFLLLATLICSEAPLPDSPRVTPVVRLIREIEPCVAAIFCLEKGGGIASGSGTVIHPDGFILTNNHVVSKDSGFVLLKDDRPRKFQVAGRLPGKDLAILRVDAGRQLPTVPIGSSHDVLTGEPLIVAGNPGGRGITFSTGILSSSAFLAGGPNALVMTTFPHSRRERYLQFDAASNPGNSGGPLVNMEGELIGIVSGSVPQEQNIGFAIPVDRVRRFFERALAPEARRGFSAGVELDPFDAGAVVSSVNADSPAGACGLRKSDVIAAVGGRPVRHAMDWWMTLVG